ncbi:MAG: type 4 pilus major pilin [Bdellovibrionales bacterium]
MTLRSCMNSAPHARRGFTLTEIAIVLGIIGLILGAIWAAASAVYNNMRSSRAQQEILTVAQNIRAMYATQSALDTSATNDTYISAGVFPSDSTVEDAAGGGASGKVAKNPWGGNLIVQANSGDSSQFDVIMEYVPQNACITLATSTTGTGRDSGLVNMKVENTTIGSSSGSPDFPVKASAAASACQKQTGATRTTNTLIWTFRLRS